MIFSDKALSQKLERTEARANAAFVETRARLDPDSGASWINVAGVYAMFDGVESPCTQTFGLGLFDEISGEHLDTLEEFFMTRSAPVFHEVSPMADATLMPLLNDRGYQPIELTSVMFRTLDAANLNLPNTNPQISTRTIANDEVDLWAQTAADGWATEMEGLADFMFRFCQIGA